LSGKNMTSKPKTKSNTKLLAAMTTIILVVSISAAAAEYVLSTSQNNPNSELPNMTLTLIGADGQQRNLTKQDLLALESYTGQGGVKSHGNEISGVGTYTGIPVWALINLVGGMASGESLTAKASDNYTMTYSYSQIVNGQDISAYNAVTGSQTTATQPLTMVLTYYRGGTALPNDEGPLRMGVLGSDGYVTDGNLWARMVIQLKVNPSISPTITPTHTASPRAAHTAAPTTSPAQTLMPTPIITIPDTQVTIKGADGTTVTLNAAQLASYTQTVGLGGKFKSQTGTFDYGTYKGVSMTTLLNLVGGISSAQVLCVTGADSYAKNYTYTEVTGTTLSMFDPVSNATATPTHPVTMILAYYLNGTATNLPTYTDGSYLVTAYVGSDGLSTTGNMFSRYIVTLQVYNL
jgi:hypothetical protein